MSTISFQSLGGKFNSFFLNFFGLMFIYLIKEEIKSCLFSKKLRRKENKIYKLTPEISN